MSHRYRRRTWADRNRPRVLDVAAGLTHESGPARSSSWAPERVAVMAHWSDDPEPSRSVVAMLAELDTEGYETVLVSAASVDGPLGRVCTWAPGAPSMPERTTVLRRPNLGYDFGSWSSVLEAFPGVRRAPRVLLVNDSLIGPFSTLAPILADFEACPAPVWGLTESLQHRPHLQSFFLGFRDRVLDSGPMRRFFGDVRVESSRAKVIRYGELAFAETLQGFDIDWAARFAADPTGPPNPAVADVRGLLAAGMPFVKYQAVRMGAAPSMVRPDPDGPGVALADWLPPGHPSGAVRPDDSASLIQRARQSVAVNGWLGAFASAARSLAR